ncbi:MAG: pyridoxal phosphate-dependent aminotransferase [Desulfobulbus sp.]|nr:MAG: pyridoxal phosphate-dependent aminotransferase [Desulfobulbus sp.]
MKDKIFLSPPHMGGDELRFVEEAFNSNYIAPVGPQIDAFEKEFAENVGAKFSAAVSSGTTALHLLLRYIGIGPGDDVLCSTFTFVASANPIVYQGGTPVFIDSDLQSWNMDPELLSSELEERSSKGCLPKAVILVHLYGQPADLDQIKAVCDRFQVVLLEDAAEALGATYKGRAPGTFGLAGFYSFNGNKIITTSGGGMIVSDDEVLIRKVKFWATQAKDDALHYEHSELGYNYRMSNILAAIGRGQLKVLSERVRLKRDLFDLFYEKLHDLPGLTFMPEPEYALSSRWLTCLTIDPEQSGTDRDAVIKALSADSIESRPTWKPMHLQPLYKKCRIVGGSISERLFQHGLCLPSGTAMSSEDVERIINLIRKCWEH